MSGSLNRVSAPAEPAPAAIGLRSLDLYKQELFEVRRIDHDIGREDYHQFLQDHYAPLGFYCNDILPSAQSILLEIRHRGILAAIFRLTEVADPQSSYFDLVPGARGADGRRRRMLEVNNVIIARPYRASIVLGLILYRSACEAHAAGYDFVVGMNRFQILRFFVDFGVIPAEHPPVFLLGKDHLCDFVNYYDTADPASITYMHERAKRYFHQEYVMRSIQERYIRPRMKLATTAAADHSRDGSLVTPVGQGLQASA